VQEPADLHVVRVQRSSGIVPHAPHGGGVERLVLEPVQPQNLVVGEVERALHAAPAPRCLVARVLPPARLAPDEVRHQRPPLATAAPRRRRRVPPHVFVSVHDRQPEAVQTVRALQERLVAPPAALRDEQVDERRLVVGLVRRPVRQRLAEDLPVLVPHGAARPHPRPRVEQVERPLAVADDEAAGVDAEPALGGVHLVVPARNDEVVARVFPPRRLEQHVGEHDVGVHPPQELRLWVREHQRAQDGQLGPEPRQLGVEHGVAVEDVEAVDAAVVHLVLERAEEDVVAVRVPAPARRRPGDHEHPGPPRRDEGREPRVVVEPPGPARVVVRHGCAERVRRVSQLARRRQREPPLLFVAFGTGKNRRPWWRRRSALVRGRAGGLVVVVLDADAWELPLQVGRREHEEGERCDEEEDEGDDRDGEQPLLPRSPVVVLRRHRLRLRPELRPESSRPVGRWIECSPASVQTWSAVRARDLNTREV